MRALRLFVKLGLVLALLLAAPRLAFAEDVPTLQQSLLLLRVLAYDRNLHARAGDALTVAVVARGEDARATEMTHALEEIAKKSKVAGLSLKVVPIVYKDADTLDAKLVETHAAAIYIAPNLADAVGAVAAATHKHTTLTACGTESMVRAGLSIGFVMREGRPTMLINLPATKAEGADLDAAVLRLAEVIR